MKTILSIAYFIVLSLLLIINSAATFFTNGPIFFMIDTAVSLLILYGVFSFIVGVPIPLWKAAVFICLLWEMYLIIGVSNSEYDIKVLWAILFGPAFYMNAKIAA